FDDRGNRMSPSFSTKNRARYPFYVSTALLRGKKALAGSVPRVSASEIEAAVMIVLRSLVEDGSSAGLTPRELVAQNIDRIVVHARRLKITLRASHKGASAPIEVAWSPAQKRDLASIDESNSTAKRPANPLLIQAIARAHAWLKLLHAGKHGSVEALAATVGVHPKVLRNQIRLAFLSPAITKTVLTGEQPTGLNLAIIHHAASISWHEQESHILRGFSAG
ncbi:MAG: hypothetical protein ACRD3E_15585, partial [Terriglobales bacterium]